MDLAKIPLMNAIVSRMHWLTGKQRVIAHNIANADTPGYIPQSPKKQDFSRLLDQAAAGRRAGATTSPVAMSAPRSGHMVAGGAASAGRPAQTEQDSLETAPNGNAVVLEEQLIELANTQMEHGLMVSLYRKNMGLLRTALGRGGGGGGGGQ